MLEMAAAEKTLKEFYRYCADNFNTPTKHTAEPEVYWKKRRDELLAPYKAQQKLAEKMGDADMLEVIESELDKFKFSTSGRGRKKSEDKVEFENAAQQKIRELTEQLKAKKAAAAAEKLLKDAAELAPVTPKNEVTVSPMQGMENYIPEIPMQTAAVKTKAKSK